MIVSKTHSDNMKAKLKAVSSSDSLHIDEEVWTYLVAECVLSQIRNGDDTLFRLLVGHPYQKSDQLGLEVQPIGPRKDEGNTHLDMALGAIASRKGTKAGIAYAGHSEQDTVCFVEAKFLSDISTKVSKNPFRDQMTRVIENLLTFQSDDGSFKQPNRMVFTLLTPRAFRRKPYVRLYGYLFEEYLVDLHRLDTHLFERLDYVDSTLPKRNDPKKWHYPNIDANIAKIALRWITYEEIFERVLLSKGFSEEDDLTKAGLKDLVSCDATSRLDVMKLIWKHVSDSD